MTWKAKHFKPEELLSPSGLDLWNRQRILLLQPSAVEKLDALREDLGLPLHVNHRGMYLRGYRHWTEHSPLPGASTFSQHLMGAAFDVSCYDMEVENLAVAALDHGFRGVGTYETFVHMDIRNSERVMHWDNRVRR